MGIKPSSRGLWPVAPPPSSSLHSKVKAFGLLLGSFVDCCEMTQFRRNVTGVQPNGGGVAWPRTPG